MNILIQFLLLSLLILSYLYYPVESFHPSVVLSVLVICALSLCSHFFLRKERVVSIKKQYLRISIIFILSHAVVHFQVYVDYVLGNVSYDNYFIWIEPRVALKSLIISASALVSYLLSYALLFRNDVRPASVVRRPHGVFLLYILSVILLLVFYLSVDKSYLFGGYGIYKPGEAADYAALLFQACVGAAIIIQCRNALICQVGFNNIFDYLRYMRFPILILAVYLIGVMVSGDRGPIIYNSLFVVFGYVFITKKKFSLLQLSVVIICAAFVVSILGVARGYDGGLGFSARILMAISNQYELFYYPESFSPFTRELAASARVLNIAVLSGEVFYGLFWVQDIMLLIPSLKGTFINVMDLPRHLTSSPQYLTYFSLGANPTWGVGTTSVADAYLNLGLLGVVLMFAAFGLLSRFLEVRSFGSSVPSYFVLAFSFSVFAFSLYIARAGILYSLSNVFYIIFFILVLLFFNKLMERHR